MSFYVDPQSLKAFCDLPLTYWKNYLNCKGWRLSEIQPAKNFCFNHPSNCMLAILLPISKEYVDYSRRLLEIIEELSRFEKRSYSDILLDITTLAVPKEKETKMDLSCPECHKPFGTRCRQPDCKALRADQIDPQMFKQHLQKISNPLDENKVNFWKEYIIKKVLDNATYKKITIACPNFTQNLGSNAAKDYPAIKEVANYELRDSEIQVLEKWLPEMGITKALGYLNFWELHW